MQIIKLKQNRLELMQELLRVRRLIKYENEQAIKLARAYKSKKKGDNTT
jgi:hypothetical protein